MILPVDASGLYVLSNEQLVAAIKERRAAIREHRDAVGKFRSWVSDYAIWAFVLGIPGFPELDSQEKMGQCEIFYEHRRSDTANAPTSFVLEKRSWDIDLKDARRPTLRGKLLQLQEAISWHYKAPILQKRPRNLEDDRTLYRVLPENLPADFRLPEKAVFLEASRT